MLTNMFLSLTEHVKKSNDRLFTAISIEGGRRPISIHIAQLRITSIELQSYLRQEQGVTEKSKFLV